nr:AAA family ATPase [Candidatus Atribacteria bacterium]
VHNEDGICIAAHIERNGIRCSFRQTAKETIKLFQNIVNKTEEEKIAEEFREYLLDSDIDAIEVNKPEDKMHYAWESKIKNKKYAIPVILAFDSHDIESMNKSEKTSFIKLSNISLKDLRESFKFPDTRIRFANDLPKPPCPCVLGVEINGSRGNSFFPNISLAFTENLNCLIGPRGSGKSTLIEAIRYVFGYNRTLNEIDPELEKKTRAMQKRNFKDSIIKVYYKMINGQIHILQATYDEKSDYTVKVFNESGEELPIPDVETAGHYPLRLFGWSEIENLGREHDRQRDLLDRLIPEVLPKLETRKTIIRELVENRKAIEKVCVELDNIFEQGNREVQKHKEYKEDFEKLNTAETKSLFSSLDFLKGKSVVLGHILEKSNLTLKQLEKIERPNLVKGLDVLLAEQTAEVKDWWLKEEQPSLNILSFEEDVKAAFDKSIQKIKSLIKIIDDKIKSINSEISNVNKEIRDKIGLEHTKQIEIDLRELAEKRLQRTKTIKQKYIEKKKDLDQLISERNKIIDKLQASIDSITSTRSRSNTAIEQKLNKFKITGLNISIFFKAGNDRQQFVTFLHDFLIGTHSRYKSRKYPEIIAHHFDPIKFSDILFKKDSAPLIDRDISVDGKNFAIETEYINGLFELKSHVSYDEYSDLEKVNKDNLTKLLEMQEVYWDDYESILLNNRPVEDLSPGQRSSAMLPLIVLSEVAPLVVDQPEDNLDNRLVGQVLVNILAELKEKRQLIIATHNPNILVSGDSEQVVVLEAVSDKEGNVSAQASIDDNDIIKTVIDIMEGGKRAFDARNARYGLIMKA